MIEVKGLSKRFGNKLVIKNLDMKIAPGEIVALLGANGAGKTTLLRILASLSNANFGRVSIAGFSLPQQSIESRAIVGFLGHKSLLYSDLSAEQNLQFVARLFSLKKVDERVDEVLELVGLAKRRRDPVRVFSRGMMQRLAIGRVILHKPTVLLLDEAHTGLDQDSVEMLNSLLIELAEEGKTILLASHDLERVAGLASRADVLLDGRIAASFSQAEQKNSSLAELYAATLQKEGVG
jgi:heme exporter protein A